MPSPVLQLPSWLTWTRIGGALLSLAAVARTVLSLVQYFERRREKALIDRNFGADYYPSDVIDAALRYYVRPYCTSVDPAQEAEIRQIVSTREDLFQAVERFLAKESPYRHILLLADSGMGKTSFVINYYAHNLKLRKGRHRRLAVVPLGVPSALDDISKIEDKKNTVIFLDAFDEDPKAMQDHRARLDDVMKACSAFNRVLITCRTQFFGSDEEIPKDTGVMIVAPRQLGESAVYEFWKLYISPLTDEQVTQFLRKRFPWFMWTKRREALNLITKIPFLSVRPMLLTYLPDVMRVGQRIEYAYQIYELMVERWLKREKGWIDPIQLRELSEWLATDLYTNRERRGAEWLPPDEFSKLLPKYNSALDSLSVRRRSLLNRDARGNLKFAHRSIMEYLYVYHFVGLPTGTRAAMAWTDLMKMFAVEMIKANAAPKASGEQQERLQLQTADLSGADYKSCTINSVCLDEAKLGKAKFAGAKVASCTFRHADLRGADFFGSELFDIDFSGADLRGADFRNTVQAEVIMSEALLDGALLDEKKSHFPVVKSKL
jgi:Pentapeptide repeats (9 copies)